MTSVAPKSAAPARRAVSALALKLWETQEALDNRVEQPAEVLDLLLMALGKGEDTAEAWDKLHESVVRNGQVADLALAYEHVASDKRVKLMQPEHQAHLHLRTAWFFAEVLGDAQGAVAGAERAIAAVPAHQEAFTLLEELLASPEGASRLARHYYEASQRSGTPAARLPLLRRAAELLAADRGSGELAVEVELQLFALDPSDARVRDDLMQRLLASGKHQQVVEILETSLKREPPPEAEEAKLLREQAMDICLGVLRDPQRALAHAEGLLLIEPAHAHARKVAEELVEHRQLGLRAAAALSTAYERTHEIDKAVAMLGFELKQVRGPRRVEVQRKLGILRQDVLGDAAGALELIGPVVAGDPGDDDLRQRFVTLSLSLEQSAQAARLLSRALQTSRDPAVRARVAADVGDVYLRSGDTHRATAAFQLATEFAADDRATLHAAKRLVELYHESKEPGPLAAALELAIKLEPDLDERQAMARRLARLIEQQPSEAARAATAWRALIGSPWNAEALERLEVIYRDSGDEEGMADVLGLRAESAKDPGEARELAFRAADMRSRRPRDRAAAIVAWQALAERYGHTAEIDERLLPLLEAEGRYGDVILLLERRAESAEPAERLPLLVRIGQLRLSHLGDVESALRTFSEVLRADPSETTARAALERLLAAGETRLFAADVLEPIYRAEGASAGIVRVLEARAELGPAETVLPALSEALDIAENRLGSTDQALELAGWGLERAVALGGDVATWLGHVERLSAHGNGQWRAIFLADALAQRAVDTPELFELARLAGAALADAGDLPRAIEVYRRALAYAPSSRELITRVDELLAQQGAPEQRLSLHASALAEEQDPARRRELLHAMAALKSRELGDVPGALSLWHRALEEEPRDTIAHDALVAALTEMNDWPALYTELARALPLAEGDRRNLILLRLGEVAGFRGDNAAALAHYRELMQSADLSDEVLEAVEHLARECGDGATARVALERALSHTAEPAARGALLERLGNVLAWMLEDRATAARVWLEGARLCESPGGDPERARQLYERVLDADPSSREAAERLAELLAEAGDWERLEEVFGVLVGLAGERDVIMLLLGLEDRAVSSGRLDAFVRLIDAGIARVGAPRARHLLLAKARAIGSLPGREDEAVALYRSLLERAGEDAAADAEAFTAFLQNAPLTPARAVDIRWLFDWRLARTASPTDLLGEWALAEETRLGNKQAAADLYARLVELDPDRVDAWSEMARLELGLGRTERALEALEALKARAEGETRYAAAVKLAALLVSPLGRPLEALDVIAPVLEANPGDLEALRIVHRTFDLPECRARASGMLERLAQVSDDRVSRAEVIEALLAVSAEAPELARARTRWLSQLLKTKQNQPQEGLRLALQGAEAAPDETDLWEAAHEITRRLGDPAPVAEAYERALERDLSPAVAEAMGQRMVEFLEEWFDDPDRTLRVLERVLKLAPTAGWAFDRLKLTFNSAGRWQDLFSLYDARLAAGGEAGEQAALLREAAMAAKDFAGDAERALGYLERLNRLAPGDTRVEATLERLYERHGRTRPLIDLLTHRLGSPGVEERGDLAARIAALWLDLGETPPAFALARDLLASGENDAGAVALLERMLALPAARTQAVDGGAPTVLESAARLLERRYRQQKSTVDVVRMLEIEVDSSTEWSERAKLLSEVAELRLDSLGDAPGAFETLLELVAIEPKREHRARLAELAGRLPAEDRRAEALVQIASGVEDATVKAELLWEAATVCDRALGDTPRAQDLMRQVVALREAAPATALEAGRRLAELLRTDGADLELVGLLEVLAALEPELAARREALGEAAERALDKLGDPARAIRDYRARLALDDEDVSALDGLVRALEAAERWDELVLALEARAALVGSDAARTDRVRIAQIQTSIKHDLAAACEAWRRVRELHGPDQESFERLGELLAQGELFAELAALITKEIARERTPERRAALERRLGALYEERTDQPFEAIDAYARALDWDAATRVAANVRGRPDLDIGTAERLFALALERWKGGDGDASAEPTVRWAIGQHTARLVQAGRDGEAVERLLAASVLPFPTTYRRELRRDAACLVSDRLFDGERAITLFDELVTADPADEVALVCVTRLSALLEERGRHAELCDLWEAQGRARAERGDEPGAAALWTRAAAIAESDLADAARALADYQRGADLGGEAALEALARIHDAAGDAVNAARALERLCAVSSAETLGERSLRLAAVYTTLGDVKRARECLEHAERNALETAAVRRRLGELYREARDYGALAALLEEEARRAVEAPARLAYLREAATLHVEERHDPAAAVPLLEQAVELAQDDAELRVSLALALHASERNADAARVLREQIQRYGARRPKDRAQVHFELARVLLASSEEAEALAELDAASRIDPTHPGITQLLASVAFRQGELDRAERMYRALLLTAGKDESGPGRTEALVALGEIAARRGDTARAGEFLESAFESALESEREADLLETALRAAGRPRDIARLLEVRLTKKLAPERAARALAELSALKSEAGETAGFPHLLARTRAVLGELKRAKSIDDGAWAAVGRALETLGDHESIAAVLEERVTLSARSSRPPADATLFYRLAAARLGDPTTREQGLELLERAVELRFDPAEAERLLALDLGDAEREPKVAVLRERVARETGDQRALVRALADRVSLPDATMAIVREGVELAKDGVDGGALETILTRALENGMLEVSPSERGWLRLELATVLDARGELSRALDLWEGAASDVSPDEARALLLTVAERAETAGDEARAVALYVRVLHDEPAEPHALRKLLALYARLGRKKEWLALVEQAIAVVDNVGERSTLRLEQARAFMGRKSGDTRAVDVLRDLLLDDPGNAEAFSLLAELLERNGRHDELAELLSGELDAAVERRDTMGAVTIASRLLGAFERAGRLPEALDVCGRALDLAPDDPDLGATLLRLAEATGEPERIADALERLLARERGPRATELGKRLVKIREQQGDEAGAERALELACVASPHDPALLEGLVSRLEARGEHARAARLIAAALETNPQDERLLTRLAEASASAGDHEQALAALNGLLEVRPDDVALLRQRALALGELGRELEALGDLERAYSLDPSLGGELVQALEQAAARAEPPEDSALALKLVDVLEGGGKLEDARARLAEFLSHKPDDLAGFRRLASLDQRLGNATEALITLERLAALETGSGLVDVALALADVAERAEQLETARPALERALEVDPEQPAVRARLEALYSASGAWRELGELLLQQAALAPDEAGRLALVLRAAEALLMPGGDAETAVRVLQVARRDTPGSIEAAALLARAYAALGTPQMGLDVLQSVAQANRGRRTRAISAVYEQIAAIHLEEGMLTDAHEALSKAFEADSKNARLALDLGRLSLEIEEIDAAQRAFRAVTIMRPPSAEGPGAVPEEKAEANYHLAVLAQKQGDPRKARVLVSKALADSPHHEGARTLLAELDQRP
jgi:tetratricopeptide (TPR) repeat protein